MRTDEASPYWVWLVSGLVTVGVGVLVLAEPGKSLKALAVITGIYLLLDSALAFVNALGHGNEGRELSAIHGVASLVLGLLLVRHPVESLTAISLFIGFWLLTIGCIRFVAAFRNDEHRAVLAGVAAVQAIAGVVIISSPHIAYGTLALITGIALVLQGALMLVLGWSLRGRAPEAASPAPTDSAAPVAP